MENVLRQWQLGVLLKGETFLGGEGLPWILAVFMLFDIYVVFVRALFFGNIEYLSLKDSTFMTISLDIILLDLVQE